jgi:segregation and condensation protein A
LLLLKADSLARQSELEPEGLDGEPLDVELANAPLPPHLERRIRRRAVAPPAPNRRVTLQELIAQLNLISATMTEQKPRRVALRRPRPQSQRQAIRAIAQLAHQENLSEVAAALEKFLSQYWDALNQGQDWLNFEVLLQIWADAQPPDLDRAKWGDAKSGQSHLSEPAQPVIPTVHDRVGVFWALLFLSAQSKVELEQAEFYQDLKVRSLTEIPQPNLSEPNKVVSLE